MKRTTYCIAALLSVAAAAHAQVIFSDTFTFPNGNTNGFALGEGLNSGINPPETRITGTAAANLRYMNVGPKPDTSFLIQANRMRVTSGSQSGRATISADGTTPFDFGSALGVETASPSNPSVYDIRLTLDNNANGTHRMSFGFGTVESSAGDWDFGLQLHKGNSADDFYTVSKRMNTSSIGIANRNDPMTTLGAGSAGTEVSFVIRITDAGAETDAYNSRIQVSDDDGASWFYDSSTDSVLTNGFRFDGDGRYLSFDVAGGNSSFVTYDNVSITRILYAPHKSVTRAPNGSLKISRASLGAVGTLTAVGSGTNSATITYDDNFIYYQANNSDNDSFTYTVSTDGIDSTGTVNVSVTSAPTGQTSSEITYDGNALSIQFAGIPGIEYTVQKDDHAEFTSPENVLTTNAPPAGVFLYVEDPAPNDGSGFYRLVH